MQATAAWQASWGVTEFTLYYRIADRPADEYRAYCAFVGRLNAILKPARPDPQVLLYYPVYDLWAEYVPVAQPLQLGSQSPRAQRIVRWFDQLGQTLQRNQIPFTLIDHERLAAAKVAGDGSLAIGNHRFRTLLLPTDAELPPPAAKVVDQWRQKGGRVLPSPVRERGALQPLLPSPARGRGAGGEGTPQQDAKLFSDVRFVEALKPPYQLSPRSAQIAAGHFVRDGRRVILLANVGREPYQGHLEVGAAAEWLTLDPATGTVTSAKPSAGRLALSLAPRQAIILVQLVNR